MIITLCGSARFERDFKAWNEALSLAGHAVFSLAVYPSDKGQKDWYSADEKKAMDRVHKAKIGCSDAIVVLNRCAYIGDSTLSEIYHAEKCGKRIYPLESWGKGNGICGMHTAEAQRQAFEVYGIPRGYGSPIDTHRAPFWECASFSDLLGAAGPKRSRLIELVNA